MTLKRPDFKSLFSYSFVLCGLTVVISAMFIFPSEMTHNIKETFIGCAGNVLPTLFPFMVISNVIVKMNIIRPAEKILEKPFSKLFNLPAASVTPFLLGLTCSFPVGAAATAESYKNNLLTKEEAEKTVALSDNTGPGFIIFLAGISIARNLKTGILIYISQIISSVMIGTLFLRKRTKEKSAIQTKERPSKVYFGKSLATSVTEAVSSCGTVAGNVVFFSLFLKAITIVFRITNRRIYMILNVILEFSGGVKESLLLNSPAGVALAAFSVCSGSVSVLFQTQGILSDLDLSVSRTVFFKLAQGVTSGMICFAFSAIFPGLLPEPDIKKAAIFITDSNSLFSALSIFTASITSICIFYSILCAVKKRGRTFKS